MARGRERCPSLATKQSILSVPPNTGCVPRHNSTFCFPLWNLEDKACCRRMRDQPISCIGDARLRGGDAAAGIEHAALGADDAARLAHAAHEGNLEFQRGIAATR